jgi:hypothetical protein
MISDLYFSFSDYEEIILDMDTNMDAMSSTLLHMRHQLTDSHRQITILNEENARLKTLYQSTTNPLSTPNGTTHTDSSSIVSTTTNTNTNNNNIKLPQKRAHPSNRTTQNVTTTDRLKTTTNLYDADETTSPPPPQSSSNEMMDTESNILTSTSTNSTNNNINNNNNNNNQNIKRTNLLENGINVTP